MTTLTTTRNTGRSAGEWMPAASLVLHARDGSTHFLEPDDLRARLAQIREELRQEVASDDSVCLLPNGKAPFERFLLELLAALGLPNPVAVPDDDTSAAIAQLARLGLTAGALGQERQPRDEPARREVLPRHALLLRTGGTSGRIRYAVNTSMRRTLGRNRRLSLASALGLKDGKRASLAGSIRHAAHLSMLLDALNYDTQVHVFEKPDPAQVLHHIRRDSVQWIVTTPLHLRIMQRQLQDGKGTSDLRTVVHMSAACSTPVKRFWHSTLGAENVYEVFGASEGIGTTVARGDEWEERPGTVGRGFYTSVSVMDSSGRPAAPGELGDVYFKSGTSARPLHVGQRDVVTWTSDGHVSIGDQGRLDTDGYLYLEPRPQLRITVGGTTVLATDIEEALLDVPGIQDAAAAAVSNHVTGQRVVCFVVRDSHGSDAERNALIPALRRVLPPAAVPRRIIEVEAVPRSPSGKVNRTAISEMAQMYFAADVPRKGEEQ
ncbi:ANL family adenylate-forming protein [Streptomyces bobili]|uniref:Fatty acid--CoA ligase family protein n=1 Tax=Streptomyces bobili TaxID=67280 RepID=A0ABZ1R9Y0_9ACTN|nr:fatty acid--CoA ligase family protein [Streptomyces bobili]